MRTELIIIIAIFIYGVLSIVRSQYYIIRINALQKSIIKYEKARIKTLEAKTQEKDAIIELWYLVFRHMLNIKNRDKLENYMARISSVIKETQNSTDDVYRVVYDNLIKPDSDRIAKFLTSVMSRVDREDCCEVDKMHYAKHEMYQNDLIVNVEKCEEHECEEYGMMTVDIASLGLENSVQDDQIVKLEDPQPVAENYERKFDDFKYRWNRGNIITKFLLAGIHCGYYSDPYQTFDQLNKILEKGLVDNEETSEGQTNSEDQHTKVSREDVSNNSGNTTTETSSDKVIIIGSASRT